MGGCKSWVQQIAHLLFDSWVSFVLSSSLFLANVQCLGAIELRVPPQKHHQRKCSVQNFRVTDIQQLFNTPLIIHHSSYITHHTPLIKHHSSYTTYHSPLVIHHSSYITHHTSLIIHHSSYTTHQTSLIIHHLSLTTHHTPLIIHFVLTPVNIIVHRSSDTTHLTPLMKHHSSSI